MIMINHWAI